LRIDAAIGAAVMAYHMGVPHRRTAPVSAGAIGWDASIGLHTNSDPWPEHERAQRLLRLTARSASFTVSLGNCFKLVLVPIRLRAGLTRPWE